MFSTLHDMIVHSPEWNILTWLDLILPCQKHDFRVMGMSSHFLFLWVKENFLSLTLLKSKGLWKQCDVWLTPTYVKLLSRYFFYWHKCWDRGVQTLTGPDSKWTGFGSLKNIYLMIHWQSSASKAILVIGWINDTDQIMRWAEEQLQKSRLGHPWLMC